MSGAAKSGSVSSFTASKVLLIVLIAKRTTTPLRIAIVSASSSATTTTAETRGGATRSSWRIRNRISLRMSWPISTRANSTTIDSTAVSGWSQNPSRGTPIRSRTWSCHTWKYTIISTWPMTPTTSSPSHAHRGARGLEFLESMKRTSHTPNTPST